MEIAKIQVRGLDVTVLEKHPIPAGIIGGYITVEYVDAVWTGLTKTVVFRSSVTRDVVTNDNRVLIPGETVEIIGERLHVGFYGTNRDGTVAIPTFWIDLGVIVEATDPSGDESADPSSPVWAQVQRMIEQGSEMLVEGETVIQQAEEARENANNASESATQAAQNADNAAESAAAAAISANEASARLESAAAGADKAAQDAVTASNNANDAAAEVLAAKASFLTAAGAAMEEIRDLVDDGIDASPIVCTASGKVITVGDSAKRLIQGFTIYGKTTQDGTPSPDAPAELVSVGDAGSVSVTVCGKNLLDAYNRAKMNVNVGATNLTVADNVVSVQTSGDPYSGFYYPKSQIADLFAIVEGKQVTIQFEARSDAPMSLYVMCFGGNTTKELTDQWQQYKVTAGKAINVETAFYNNGNTMAATTLYVRNIMISFDADDVYESYKGKTLAVPTSKGLPGIPVTSDGNYTDEAGQQWVCDYVDFARGKYVRNVWRATIDSNTNLNLAQISGYCRYGTIDKTVYPPCKYGFTYFGFCNRLTISPIPISTNNINNAISPFWEGNVYFRMDEYETIEELKAYLADNPIIVEYILATPIETDLTEEELAAYAALHTNYPNTTIYNDEGAYMEVKYVADTKLYIDNKFTELAAALVSNS